MLTDKFAIYIPSTINGDQPAIELQKKWTEKAARCFAELFGGFTIIPATGGYYSEEKGLIQENVNVVQAWGRDGDIDIHRDEIMQLAHQIRLAMTQECVLVELGRICYMIEEKTVSNRQIA